MAKYINDDLMIQDMGVLCNSLKSPDTVFPWYLKVMLHVI